MQEYGWQLEVGGKVLGVEIDFSLLAFCISLILYQPCALCPPSCDTVMAGRLTCPHKNPR